MTIIECELIQILISENSTSQIIVLKELNGSRTITIEIGINEAVAIKNSIDGYELPRPLTHDLLYTTIEALTAQIKHIIVSDIRPFDEGGAVYYSILVLEDLHQKEVSIDCRPSDAIALAVRCGCKIFVAEDVLKIASE